MMTWKQVQDRGNLGAHRGKGIFLKLLSEKFYQKFKRISVKRSSEHKNSKENNGDYL